MADLVILVVSVAAIDSLNPSTIVPALFLISGQRPYRAVTGFAAGVFAVNLAGGIVALVVGQRIAEIVPHPSLNAKHWSEVAVGVVALAAAYVLWHRRRLVSAQFARADVQTHRIAPLTGVTIALVELPTAFPYFAVIAAIVGSDAGIVAAVAMLVLFNIVFLAPALMIMAARAAAGDYAFVMIERARRLLIRYAGSLIAGIVLVLALALIAVGAAGIASTR